jgi:hypothetical protein
MAQSSAATISLPDSAHSFCVGGNWSNDPSETDSFGAGVSSEETTHSLIVSCLQISRTHMTTPFVSSLGSFDTSYPRPAAPGLASACRWPSKNMLDTSARFVQNLGYGHVEYNLLMDPLRHTVLLVFSFCPLQIPKLFFCPSLAFCNPSYTTPGAF